MHRLPHKRFPFINVLVDTVYMTVMHKLLFAYMHDCNPNPNPNPHSAQCYFCLVYSHFQTFYLARGQAGTGRCVYSSIIRPKCWGIIFPLWGRIPSLREKNERTENSKKIITHTHTKKMKRKK